MRSSDWSSDGCSPDLAFAVAQRRDRIDEAACACGHRRVHEMLVALVVEAHRDDRAALRQHAFGKVRGALGDQAQRHAIFTAFLGNPFENLARRLPGADVLRRNVAMRLFADARSEEHTSELQSLMRISYAVFCLKKKTNTQTTAP